MATAFQSSAFQNDAYQIGVVVVQQDSGGRRIRHRIKLGQDRVESEADKFARRILEGTLPAPVVESKPTKTDRYVAESARLAQSIAKVRQDAKTYRAEVERLEAAQVKRQTAKLQRELLLAQQALQLATVQEAVFLEEMEVVDIAFVASAVLTVVLQ